MPLENFIISVYVHVDNFLQTQGRLRKRGASPKLSDAEVITMEIVGEYLGFGSDKKIFEYFENHWKDWFPGIGVRTTFTRQCANLGLVKDKLRASLLKDNPCDLFLFDGFPIPTCHIKRAFRRHNPFLGTGSVGYCATKDEKYFGFKGHLVVTAQGLPIRFTIAAANVDERDVVPELTQGLTGMIIADKGLIRPSLKEELKRQGLDLQTPLKKNMVDHRPKSFVKAIVSMRRSVETVISQLVDRMKIQSIRAKDLWHLSVKTSRKILAHTFFFSINRSLNPLNPLQFNAILP